MVADFIISSGVSTLKAIGTSKHLSLEHVKPKELWDVSSGTWRDNHVNFCNIFIAVRRRASRQAECAVTLRRGAPDDCQQGSDHSTLACASDGSPPCSAAG
jgi:hypothetical protein